MDAIFKILSILIVAISIVLFFVDKKKYYKFTFVSLVLFPKANLLTVGGSTTGIRYDDFMLLAFLILSFGEIIFILQRNHTLRCLHLLVVVWVLMGLLSTFVGALQGTVESSLVSILTSIRKYEYFVAIFVGYFYFKNYDQRGFFRTLKFISLVLLVICGLQFAGIIGGFVSGSYLAPLGYPIGVFNGAYEYACVMCAILCIFLYDALTKRFSSFLFVLVVVAQILLSQSRSGIVLAATLVLLMSLKYSKVMFVMSLALGIVFLIALKTSTSFLDRFATIDIKNMINILSDRFAHGDYFAAVRKIPDEAMFPFVKSDLSFYVRTTKWGAAFDGFKLDPLFGYGPGQISVLDGSYVKLLCEGGIFSFAIFVIVIGYLFYSFKKSNSSICKWTLFVMLCFALFIDIFDSSKSMQFMWMIAGLSLSTLESQPSFANNPVKLNSISQQAV